jgi:hypothetical protein
MDIGAGYELGTMALSLASPQSGRPTSRDVKQGTLRKTLR